VLELLADDRALAGGSRRNRQHAESFTTFEPKVEERRRRLVCDAMTSGGLLVALPAGAAPEVAGAVVGRLVNGRPGSLVVRAG
jgi:selenide,water dikinase